MLCIMTAEGSDIVLDQEAQLSRNLISYDSNQNEVAVYLNDLFVSFSVVFCYETRSSLVL